VKFTSKGEVVVRLQAGKRSDGHTELKFAVTDTGIGIPPEGLDRLFKSFSQVDASTTRRFGGTGLGLAISKRLVELMGGAISVESQDRRGSTFRFTVIAEPVPSPARAFLTAGKTQFAGRRILIVDDNSTSGRILTALAAGWGLEAHAVTTGVDALAWLRMGEACDIVIIDRQMPQMDGVTLAQEIHRLRTADDLPLVLLSSLGHQDLGEDRTLFTACLNKPAKPELIFEVLNGLLTNAPAPAVPAKREPVVPVVAPTRAERVLLAEDNPVNRKVALIMLEKLGYRTDVAANGKEAVEAVNRERFDMVLMDVQMPEMDGLEATARVVERWPLASDRPWIIALTANAMQGDRERCMAAGMDDYITKPIRQEDLVAALERARVARVKAVTG
jgi:CheY-like chemotaxis protein